MSIYLSFEEDGGNLRKLTFEFALKLVEADIGLVMACFTGLVVHLECAATQFGVQKFGAMHQRFYFLLSRLPQYVIEIYECKVFQGYIKAVS